MEHLERDKRNAMGSALGLRASALMMAPGSWEPLDPKGSYGTVGSEAWMGPREWLPSGSVAVP